MDPAARDEAVRRLRAESARRLGRQERRRTVSSWCALATMAAGVSMLALAADQARLRELEVARQATRVERIRSEEERTRLEARVTAARRAVEEASARAELDAEREKIRMMAAEAMVLREPVIELPRKRSKPRVISCALGAAGHHPDPAPVRPETLDELFTF